MKVRVAALALAGVVECTGARRAESASHAAASTTATAETPTTAPATSGGIARVSIGNLDGLHGLLLALDDVDRVELVSWKHGAQVELLSPSDTARLLQLIERGGLIEEHTVAHPPWPAAFLFHTRSHGLYAGILVGHSNLRLDSGRSDGRFEGAAAQWNDSPPPEMVLDDEEGWLWSYCESHLGATREQEYLMQKAPDYLELPRRP